jgi:uncharacterized protein (TIGR02611 family)
VASEKTGKPPLVDRLREQRDRHAERSRIVRALYVAAGFTILVAGLAMLVTPGPAFVVIPIGLAVLSLEFAWAEELLERAIEQGEKARRTAVAATPTQRALSAIATVLAIAAIVAWALLGDIPVLPV